MNPYPLVMIEWEDSAQPVSNWQWVNTRLDVSIIGCRSVGWLVHDGDDVKALMPNIATDDDGDVQGSGLIRIPTRCVLRITEIGISPPPRDPPATRDQDP